MIFAKDFPLLSISRASVSTDRFISPIIIRPIQNLLGDTALHGASWKGHANAVRLLISAGAKQDVKNKELKQPRDLAREPIVAALFARRTSAIDDEDYLDEEEEEEGEQH